MDSNKMVGELWDQLAQSNSRYTIPWLSLTRSDVLSYITSNDPLSHGAFLPDVYPAFVVAEAINKKCLLLGCGGGQQSAVFGLAGAKVVSLDISAEQLLRDKIAANHYGFPIETVLGDMVDASRLVNDTFDMVYGEGLCFVENIVKLYSEVEKVCHSGSIVRFGHNNPASIFLKLETKQTLKYSPHRETKLDTDMGIIYKHSFAQILYPVTNMNWTLIDVREAPCHFRLEVDCMEDYQKMQTMLQTHFAYTFRIK